MKIRIKFEKYGNMKFIGHLDVMRYFQKAIRRADVDIRYSEGFSPHQIMSFAAPLGVGITSRGEYVDIDVLSTDSSAQMVSRLNQVMSPGFRVLSYRQLPDHGANAMSIVAAADYTLCLRPGYGAAEGEQGQEITEPGELEEFFAGLLKFYDRDQVLMMKKTKKGQREMDLKPLVYELASDMEEGVPVLHMKISAGSVANVKPDQVLGAYYDFLGIHPSAFAWQQRRDEVYADLASEEEKQAGIHRFATLEDLGEEIKV